MKESAKLSPFAALNPREQKEQWIWWQCQHPEGEKVMEEPLDEPKKPLPDVKPLPEAVEVQRELSPVPAPVIRHGQYDSVIRRMNQARQQTGDYIPCTGSLSTNTEPGAGS